MWEVYYTRDDGVIEKHLMHPIDYAEATAKDRPEAKKWSREAPDGRRKVEDKTPKAFDVKATEAPIIPAVEREGRPLN
jgi:hypothetical protein